MVAEEGREEVVRGGGSSRWAQHACRIRGWAKEEWGESPEGTAIQSLAPRTLENYTGHMVALARHGSLREYLCELVRLGRSHSCLRAAVSAARLCEDMGLEKDVVGPVEKRMCVASRSFVVSIGVHLPHTPPPHPKIHFWGGFLDTTLLGTPHMRARAIGEVTLMP